MPRPRVTRVEKVENLVTLKQAAKQLGISRDAVYKRLRYYAVDTVKIGPTILLRPEDLQEIAGRDVDGRGEGHDQEHDRRVYTD